MCLGRQSTRECCLEGKKVDCAFKAFHSVDRLDVVAELKGALAYKKTGVLADRLRSQAPLVALEFSNTREQPMALVTLRDARRCRSVQILLKPRTPDSTHEIRELVARNQGDMKALTAMVKALEQKVATRNSLSPGQ